MSDVHLEFCDLTLPGDKDSTLLLAGDITVAGIIYRNTALQERSKRFFFEECAKYGSVYYIMGNHEHYHGIWQETANTLKEFLQGSNVTFLDKESVDVEPGLVLWGGTLWTNMKNESPGIMNSAQFGMNDYHIIYYQTEGVDAHIQSLLPTTTVAEHYTALEDLKEFLKSTTAEKVVVMTHMAPSSKSSHPRYGLNNPLNWAYYSDLEYIMLDNPKIKTYVHGHTHDSHDYMIGDCRVMCNPRGYCPSPGSPNENSKFDINFTFEV